MLKNVDFKYLSGLFADPEPLDIADATLTVEMYVTIGGTRVDWAYTLGDLGGTPSSIDCTPLASPVQLQKAGQQEQDQWEVSYIYNKKDITAIEGWITDGTSKAIVVHWPNGDTWSNNGVCASNRISSPQVNNRGEGVATFNLSGKWVYTPAA